MYDNVIVIDANFILLPFQFKVDYLDEIISNLDGKTHFIIYKQILDELEAKIKRESQARKFEMEYKAGISYLDSNKDKYNIVFDDKVKKRYDTTDKFLIEQCSELKRVSNHVFLATNDSRLRKEARGFGIRTIFLRQKKYLSFD